MPRQADCRRRTPVDDGTSVGSTRGKPDEMNDPSKQSPPSTLDTVLIPVPLESSLQHSNFRQLTNCIQDVHEVRYVPRTSADDVMRPIAFLSRITRIMKKSAQRDANTARALAVVRFGHRPPVRPLSQTHRQDRLQYTAPQCNKCNRTKRAGQQGQ